MRVAESRGKVQRAVAPLCNTCDFIFVVKKRIFNSPSAVKQQYACSLQFLNFKGIISSSSNGCCENYEAMMMILFFL